MHIYTRMYIYIYVYIYIHIHRYKHRQYPALAAGSVTVVIRSISAGVSIATPFWLFIVHGVWLAPWGLQSGRPPTLLTPITIDCPDCVLAFISCYQFSFKRSHANWSEMSMVIS